jgi:alkanesulfonate monooxygenase SsuD/methylene tetrahydromethanopterin reductase-like flavin-dependent oxidoreductase (luciferase family)
MTALTLDHLSEGRLLLGLGVSGRAVVERWHGTPFHPPIRWTREYIALVRALVAGRPAHNIYPLPDAVDSPGGSSADRGLRTYLPARRQEIPIYLAAQGPKNLALAAEYCEGAIIAYFDPAAADWYAAAIAIGLERRQRSTDFKMVAMPFVEVGSDVEAAAATVKPRLAFYLARMGSPGANYYANALGRLGFGEVCQKIVALYDSGETDLAARQVPTEMVEAVACVGPIDTVCARLKSFRAAGADTVVCRGTVDSLRQLAVALRGSG